MPTSRVAASFKERIRSGEQLSGVSLPPRPDAAWLAEQVARKPYDWVNVDSQHSPLNEETLRDFCAIAAELPVPVMFRIKHTRLAFLIGNYLDLGPTAIEVPQVEQETTVLEAVANFYYSPVGVRSVGGRSRVGVAGKNLDEYIAFWHETGALAMQIESLRATLACRSLAKPGVDFVTFGPVDLTLNLRGYPNQPLQNVDDCVRYVGAELADVQTRVCVRVPAGTERSAYLDMGVTMFLEPPSA
jgi:2-keto-3-deoxy-L-rhamnonate aldolase RhmA